MYVDKAQVVAQGVGEYSSIFARFFLLIHMTCQV